MAQETAWSATGSSSASAPAASSEVEGDSLSTAQKSTLKWEKEETLGELATVAPVLYTNVNFPNLKEEYPGLKASYLFSQYIYRSNKIFKEELLFVESSYILIKVIK